MISKKVKNRLYLVGLVVLVLIVGVIIRVKLTEESESNSPEKVGDYQYHVSKPQLISYSNGEKSWYIESETITQPKTGDDKEIKVILKNIKEGKLYANNKLKYLVDANKITYYEQSKNIELEGAVSLAETRGEKMLSDFFFWDEEQKNLTTDEGVTVKMKDGKLTAERMKLDLETQVIDFTGNVVMTFQVEGAESDEE